MVALRIALAALLLCSAAVTLPGCETRAGGTPPALSPTGLLREAPDAARGGAYVTQANGAADGNALEYAIKNKSNAAPKCSIGGQKFDHTQIAVDNAGNLYLPNLTTGVIRVYAPNCGRAIASISDPYGSDSDVTVGANAIYGVGVAHVAVCSMSGCTSELTDPSISQLETAAVDSHGNVWASYYNKAGTPSLVVWPGGSMPAHVASGYVNQNTPGDLSFDKRGTLVSLQSLFTHVYLYKCDAATASCTNTRIVQLKNGSLFGALDAKNTIFAVTNYEGDSVDVYTYPGFKYKYSYNQGLLHGYSAQGIAISR